MPDAASLGSFATKFRKLTEMENSCTRSSWLGEEKKLCGKFFFFTYLHVYLFLRNSFEYLASSYALRSNSLPRRFCDSRAFVPPPQSMIFSLHAVGERKQGFSRRGAAGSFDISSWNASPHSLLNCNILKQHASICDALSREANVFTCGVSKQVKTLCFVIFSSSILQKY